MVSTSPWILIVVSLLAGVVLGLVAGYLGFPAIREAKRLRVQLDDALREHETYKTSVNAHFRKTGELVNQMTKSYAAVYDHLAAGARTLGDGIAAESTLPFGPSPELLASPVIESSAAEADPPADAAPADTAGTNGAAPSVAASDGVAEGNVSTAGTSAEVEPDLAPAMATTAEAESPTPPARG